MTLLDLKPELLKATDAGHSRILPPDAISQADGIMFLCPVCFEKNKGPVGTHSIICWQPHVPQSHSPTGGRWNFVGNSLEDLSLKAGSSSVLLTGGCNAHFLITNGKIDICP